MPKYYMALQYFQALPASSEFRMKSLTDPRHCVCIYLHYCLQSVRGDVAYRTKQLANRVRNKVGREFVLKPKSYIRVKPSEMLVHHYRTHCYLRRYSATPLTPDTARSSCNATLQRAKTNNFMIKYKQPIIVRVTSVLRRLQLI